MPNWAWYLNGLMVGLGVGSAVTATLTKYYLKRRLAERNLR